MNKKTPTEKFGSYTIPTNTSELARDVLLRLYKDGIVMFAYDHGNSLSVGKELIEIANSYIRDSVSCHELENSLLLIDHHIYECVDGRTASEEDCLKKGQNHGRQKVMPKAFHDFLSRQGKHTIQKLRTWFVEESHALDHIVALLDEKKPNLKKDPVMKRIIRDRPVTPEEAEKYNKIREQVEQEFPPSPRKENMEKEVEVAPMPNMDLKDMEDPTIPKSFKAYLEGLSDTDAEQFWGWVDGHPYIEDDILDIISKSHPALEKKITGDI